MLYSLIYMNMEIKKFTKCGLENLKKSNKYYE